MRAVQAWPREDGAARRLRSGIDRFGLVRLFTRTTGPGAEDFLAQSGRCRLDLSSKNDRRSRFSSAE